MQLLTVAVPELEKKAKEGGESGRKEINRYTRILTLALAIFQGTLLCFTLRTQGGLFADSTGLGLGVKIVQVVLAITAGTAFLLWLGESITEKGIGNGVSLIIFGKHHGPPAFQLWHVVDIVPGWRREPSPHPGVARDVRHRDVDRGGDGTGDAQGTRAARPARGRRGQGYGGWKHLPAVQGELVRRDAHHFCDGATGNPADCGTNDPPHLGGTFFQNLTKALQPGFTPFGLLACAIYTIVIMAFTYFYTAVMMNIPEMSDNLKKWNAFIPGIRPGKDTTAYLDRVMTASHWPARSSWPASPWSSTWRRRVGDSQQAFSLYGGNVTAHRGGSGT